MSYNRTIYFHANIIAPYRVHQFRLIAKTFPKAVFCLNGILDDDGENIWDRHPEFKESYNWIRIAEQNTATAGKGRGNFSWTFFKLLLTQRWGTVHVVGDGLCRWNGRMLLLSGLIGHSKLIWWHDGFLKDQLKEPLPSRSRQFLMRHVFAGAWMNGRVGREVFARRGMPPGRIANQMFSCNSELYEAYYQDEKPSVRETLRESFGIGRDDYVVLNIARHLYLKRIGDLAEAAQILEERHRDMARHVVLVHIGGGSQDDHSEILAELKDVKVVTLPPQPAQDMLKYYAMSDVFVFPSEGDVWGVVVNEALSMGLPVVCTDIIGACELVNDGVNGYVVPVRSPGIIAEKLLLLFSDRQRLSRMQEAARNRMREWTTQKGIDSLARLVEGD